MPSSLLLAGSACKSDLLDFLQRKQGGKIWLKSQTSSFKVQACHIVPISPSLHHISTQKQEKKNPETERNMIISPQGSDIVHAYGEYIYLQA